MADMARWMGCDIGEFLFTYLGFPIGENMKRVNAWNPVVEKFKIRLGEWKARTMLFEGRLRLVKSVLGSLSLYYFLMFRVPLSVIKNLERIRNKILLGRVGVIKSIYGVSGGLGDVRAMGREGNGGRVWSDIVKIGVEINGLRVEFSSSRVGVVGDGKDISFWVDRWVDNQRLCDGFLRWSIDEDGEFTVKELSRMIDENILRSDNGGQETL
nr:hypothetical protein [Tanacetum cinerariifolium]GEY36562.1 hypothetical protein [Tanacetum cinerariifolium]